MNDEPEIVLPTFGDGSRVEPAPDPAEPKVVLPSFGKPKKSAREKMRELDPDGEEEILARMRGLTFGLSDRAIAGVKSLTGPKSYKDNLGEIQGKRDAYRERSPVAAFGNELVMGLASGGAISDGIRKVASKALPAVANYAKQAGILPAAARVAAPLAESALYGEVSAQAEKPYGKVGEDLGKGAALGAGVGGAAMLGGKALGAAGRATSKIGQRIGLAAGITNPEKYAAKRFNRSLQESNMTPEEVLEAAKFLRGDDLMLQGPSLPGQELPDLRTPVRIADVLPTNTKNVVKKGARASERARAELENLVSNRNAEQGMRIQGHVDSTLSDDVDSSAALERLSQERSQKAGPHYDQAYAVGTVRDPIVDRWINDRKVNARLFNELKQSLDDNASKGMGEGKPMTAILDVNKKGELVWKQRPTIEDLDTIKKHLDSKIGELWDPVQMKYRKPKKLGESDADQLKHTRDDLIKMIDKLTPDGQGGSHYSNARKAFADDSDLIDAQREGMTIIRTRPEDIKRKFDSLAGRPELQQQFRAGVAASISDLLDKASTNGGEAIVRKLWGTPGIQKKLEYIMADSNTADQFRRNMGAEQTFIRTQKDLVPKGGATDLLSASDAEGFSLPLAAANALTGRFGSAANHLGRFGMGAISGVVPEVGDDLARIAMMTPEQFEQWTKAQRALSNTPGAKAKKAVGALTSYVGRGVAPASASLAGRAVPQEDQQGQTNGVFLDE